MLVPSRAPSTPPANARVSPDVPVPLRREPKVVVGAGHQRVELGVVHVVAAQGAEYLGACAAGGEAVVVPGLCETVAQQVPVGGRTAAGVPALEAGENVVRFVQGVLLAISALFLFFVGVWIDRSGAGAGGRCESGAFNRYIYGGGIEGGLLGQVGRRKARRSKCARAKICSGDTRWKL